MGDCDWYMEWAVLLTWSVCLQVHVAHAIIDGVIDIPRTKEWLKDMPKEAKLSADAVSLA